MGKSMAEYLSEKRAMAETAEAARASGLDFENDFVAVGMYNKAVAGGAEISADPEQLRMGVEVEKEHTTNDRIAERIALDHLAEIPDYYTRLKKMEDEAKRAKKGKGED